MKKILTVILLLLFVSSLVACIRPCEHEYVSVKVAPTCTAEGYTEHTCSKCGESYRDTTVGVVAHRFNGADCLVCGFKHPTDPIKPDTSWFTEDLAVFTVTTAEQLAGIAELVNSGNPLSHMQIYLGADIDLNYAPWTPIGNADNYFSARFVGNGYTISHLLVISNSSFVGLFGNVTGELSDFTIKYASVFAQGANTDIGIICGSTSAKISGVKADGFIDAKDSSNVGGIVGSTSSSVSASESNADIVGFDHVGGIVGYVKLSPSVFEDLVNHGNISANNCVGGIFGGVHEAADVIYVDECQNNGNISGKSHVGGIAGYMEGKVNSIIQSTSSGAVISGDYYVGGLVGEAVNVAISNCSNEGSEISASSCLLVNDMYYAYLGGYVGKGYSVDHCVNNVPLTYLARGLYVGGIAGYLSNGVTDCENNADITANDNVGGIAGYVSTNSAMNVLNLKNNANITAKSKVGGIAGEWKFSAPLTFGESSNSGKINGTNILGGLIGEIGASVDSVISVYNASNTGDVYGTEHRVGGLFGEIWGKNDSSSIANSSVSANISGLYLVGGLVGKTNSVLITDCSNDGSTVSATGFVIEGEANHAYLGGYAGYGYKISNCTNDVDVTYTSLGSYIGGIAGYAINSVLGCTNNGDISAVNSSDVGGIIGAVDSPNALSFTDIENNGNINGKIRVGGIIGMLSQPSNVLGNWYKDKSKGSDEYNHYHIINTDLKDLSNTGSVTGQDDISGIIGHINVYSSYSKSHERHCSIWYGDYCYNIGDFGINSNNLKNSGNISGNNRVGEIYGFFNSDGPSTLTDYAVTGKVTINGAAIEKIYDIGESTNLTLSGRTGPETDFEGGDEVTE